MNNEKNRILILTTSYLPMMGGSEMAIKEIAQRLPEFKFDLVTARFRKDLPIQETVSNIEIFRMGNKLSLLEFFLPKVFLPISIFLKARQLIKIRNYNLIHVYQASQAGGAAWFLKFFSNLPMVLTMQEGKDLTKQKILNIFRKAIIKRADFVTVISSYLDRFVKHIDPEARTIIIPNGVKFSKFDQVNPELIEETKRKLHIKNEKIIISISRLVSKNGLRNLIEACQYLNFPFKLLLVGSGPMEQELKERTLKLGLDNNVVFLGDCKNEDLPKYLKVSDLFIRPSLSEGLGNAFFEALAAGLPIIGSPVGGIPDFLSDSKTGFFCDPNDPKNISDKIKYVLHNPELAQATVKAGQELVKNKYNWDIVAVQMKEVYNKSNDFK